MECACINVAHSGSKPIDSMVIPGVRAKRNELCDECLEEIAAGERFEKTLVQWDLIEGRHTYRMCLDCQSLREAFFCNGYIVNRLHESLWEHVVDTDGEVLEACLASLTPRALAMICVLIEEMWEGFPEIMWSAGHE